MGLSIPKVIHRGVDNKWAFAGQLRRVRLKVFMAFYLHLVGACVLEREAVPVSLGKRSNALLAYLALEGITARGTIATLLWNETDEERARASLRQEVYRINQIGEIVLNDRHHVWLANSVEHDLDLFNSLEGEFASGLTLDELEFEAWLDGARALLRDKRSAFLEAEVRRLSLSRDWRDAMLMARRVLSLDRFSESAHRDYIRLAYLADDRVAVRAAILDLRRVLREELAMLPEAETTQLIQAVEQGRLPKPDAPQARRIPMTVLRPPKLAGSRAWQALIGGVTRGKAMFVSGELGSGKTRLLSELAASRSALGAKVLELRCRETESTIPFAALIQAVRDHVILEKHLGQQSHFPELWRGELARLIPELRDPNLVYRSLEQSSEFGDARARVLESFTQYALSISAPNGMLILDDLHWADPATLEWLSYATPRLLPFGVAVLAAYQNLEAGLGLRDLISKLEAAGLANRIDLEPFALPEIEELLGGIDRRATQLASELLRVTGGNPLFIVETLKHLLESGQLDEQWQLQGTLEPPERIGALLRRRLERMTPLARRVLGVVALLDSSDGALVANTLRADELEVAQALAEAQQNHMLREDGAFSHDAVRRTVLEFLPEAVQRALHRRAAQILETQNADANRIASHYNKASDARLAAPHLIRAAEMALEQLEPSRALALLEGLSHQNLEVNLEARWRIAHAEALLTIKKYAEAARDAQTALLMAKRSADVLLEHRASLVLSEAQLLQGKLLEVRSMLEPLLPVLGFDHQLRAQAALGWAEVILGDIGRAVKAFEQTIPWGVEAQIGRALTAWYIGKTRDSLHAAQVAVESSPDGFKRVQSKIILGIALWTRGQFSDAISTLNTALEHPEAQIQQRIAVWLARAPIYLSRGQFNHALEDIEYAQETANTQPNTMQNNQLADAQNQLGLLYGLCGNLDTSLDYFAQSIHRCETNQHNSALIPRGLRTIILALHQDPRHQEAAREAMAHLEPSPHALGRCYTLLGAAESALAANNQAQALELSETLLNMALEYEMPEMRAYAQLLIGTAKPDQNALESALTLAQSIGLTLVIARAAIALQRKTVAQSALEMLLEHIPSTLRSFAAQSIAAKLLATSA
jgi:DNA-binding SARP family transcriptional activator/tetratricopeptide (TPR) repeat protein